MRGIVSERIDFEWIPDSKSREHVNKSRDFEMAHQCVFLLPVLE